MMDGLTQKLPGFPRGLRTATTMDSPPLMRFPSCWSGRDFDPAHPLAHMDFPKNQNGLAGCREGFKLKRFLEIFIEYYLNAKCFNEFYGLNMGYCTRRSNRVWISYRFCSFSLPPPHFPLLTPSKPPGTIA